MQWGWMFALSRGTDCGSACLDELYKMLGARRMRRQRSMMLHAHVSLLCFFARSLQSLATSLGPLLCDRQWQQGSYNADVLVALTGDAALSGALALGKADGLQPQSTSSRRPTGQSSNATW